MTNDSTIIKTSDLRECHFYWNHMVNRGFKMPPMPSKIADICSALNSAFSRQKWTDEELQKYIKAMKEAANERLIPRKELDWISAKDERLCYWIWANCRLAVKSDPEWGNGLTLDFNQGGFDRPYVAYGLNLLPHTATERYDCVISFLDSSKVLLERKRALLEKWREQWEIAYSTERFLKPAPNDEEYCTWLWNYITTNEEYPIEHWFLPQPKTPNDMFKAAVAAFDIWDKQPDTKKLFIVRMKKAWSQKKHRMAIAKKNKKSYNFTLTTTTKSLLDEMADTTGYSRNEVLERLIKLGHHKLSNGEEIL